MNGFIGVPNRIAHPRDIGPQQRVFDRFCEDHRIDDGGRGAEEIAWAIVAYFPLEGFDLESKSSEWEVRL